MQMMFCFNQSYYFLYSPEAGMSTGSPHLSLYSGSSAQSADSFHPSVGDPSTSDDAGMDQTTGQLYAAQAKSYRHRTQAWWTVGEYLETGTRGGTATGITHQSAKFSLTGRNPGYFEM